MKQQLDRLTSNQKGWTIGLCIVGLVALIISAIPDPGINTACKIIAGWSLSGILFIWVPTVGTQEKEEKEEKKTEKE